MEETAVTAGGDGRSMKAEEDGRAEKGTVRQARFAFLAFFLFAVLAIRVKLPENSVGSATSSNLAIERS